MCSQVSLAVSMCVVAVFKILKLSPDQLEVQNDLRDLPHKQLNLNFSSNDVQWNPKDGERKLIQKRNDGREGEGRGGEGEREGEGEGGGGEGGRSTG